MCVTTYNKESLGLQVFVLLFFFMPSVGILQLELLLYSTVLSRCTSAHPTRRGQARCSGWLGEAKGRHSRAAHRAFPARTSPLGCSPSGPLPRRRSIGSRALSGGDFRELTEEPPPLRQDKVASNLLCLARPRAMSGGPSGARSTRCARLAQAESRRERHWLRCSVRSRPAAWQRRLNARRDVIP